jgi:hypothetical protein
MTKREAAEAALKALAGNEAAFPDVVAALKTVVLSPDDPHNQWTGGDGTPYNPMQSTVSPVSFGATDVKKAREFYAPKPAPVQPKPISDFFVPLQAYRQEATQHGMVVVEPERAPAVPLGQRIADARAEGLRVRKSRSCANGHAHDAAYTECPQCGASAAGDLNAPMDIDPRVLARLF